MRSIPITLQDATLLEMRSAVKQRAKMTPLECKTASKIDPP